MLQVVPNTSVGFLYIIFHISTESLQAANEEKKNREDKLKRESDELSKRKILGKSSFVFMFFEHRATLPKYVVLLQESKKSRCHWSG